MIPFWAMFLIPTWGVLMPYRLPEKQARIALFAVGLVFAILMGLRHEVGGDWGNYLPMFERTAQESFVGAISQSDPAYSGLNWLVAHFGGGIYWTNLFCATILAWGTIVFCRRQPNPWLALVAAVPYMLIVVGMGYTRQSVALGFALLGLAALGDRRTTAFVMWIALGALFHKSAVLLLPIAALAASRNRVMTASLVIAATLLMYYLLLQDSTEAMWTNYVSADMQSQGGAIRVTMNAVPAILLFLFRKRLVPDDHERKLWLWIAAFALACVPLVSSASTAVDRIALYLIPLQLFVFARVPRLARSTATRTPLVLAMIGYYAAVQYVWLNYATHAKYWVPYSFMPLGF